MQTVAISLRSLLARPLATLLNLLLLSLGLASATLVLQVASQIEQAFERDVAGIDLVVGAKGSPLQLILAGVFHLDAPSGNVALADVMALAASPQVAQMIPLSLGDSVAGFRVVGTTSAYLQHYRVTLAQGQVWSQPLEAVIGALVARQLGWAVGAQFVGAHGLAGGGAHHDARPFTVRGVLQPCACVLDRLVMTSLESVWQVHGKEEHASDGHPDEREITLALIRYQSPLSAVSFPRYVNTTTRLQAAAPALEITRLLRMLGVGADVLRGFAAVLLLMAALSVFMALWHAVRERQPDLAMLRMLGAPPRRLAALVLAEALWLAMTAGLIGLLAGHGLTMLVAKLLAVNQSLPVQAWQWASGEGYVLLLGLGVTLCAALLPVWSAYRVDVTQLLNRP
ncbi:MAG: hypothetical protein RLZZ401_1528 [Pseudomonadota bacterium]|jgi:putative ABC transport system permease protein